MLLLFLILLINKFIKWNEDLLLKDGIYISLDKNAKWKRDSTHFTKSFKMRSLHVHHAELIFQFVIFFNKKKIENQTI